MNKKTIRFGFVAAAGTGLLFGLAPASAQSFPPIKTVFIIALENHDWTQTVPEGGGGRPEQIFGNPAAPYVNSLVNPTNPISAQVSYATKYYNVGQGVHPSEPNYIWMEAGTEFGIHTDDDPSPEAHNVFTAPHLSAQLTAAGIAWRCYQEDLEYSKSSLLSASGAGVAPNPYNGTTEYNYAVKHNPMAFFPDTQNQNCYTFKRFWTDLAENKVGRYNWITPDQYNEMHSSLPHGYIYHGTKFRGNQAAIAEGDNCLSIIIPKIMASPAYQDNGAIFIWTDETVSTDDTHTTLPFIVISPLAKGHAYASDTVYTHSSVLKSMDELFGIPFQTNAIPAEDHDAFGTGYSRVADANDLSDLFRPTTAH